MLTSSYSGWGFWGFWGSRLLVLAVPLAEAALARIAAHIMNFPVTVAGLVLSARFGNKGLFLELEAAHMAGDGPVDVNFVVSTRDVAV